ncbi:hypothetical protein FRB91_009764 [Serendipita sp. 411]|nr:hypothetical protein FRC19_004473 [Serendipita sp. 401]KAG8858454.1 hypothetical protein FRB91_009764 [Serendipita sp. 411]KAG9057861.1 hypothetical protein FS842_003623 [Serendipita sp. 407]
MSLDQNLFTLAIAGSTEEQNALDLTDPNTGTIHYRKRVTTGDAENPYSWGLYDPLSGGLLCTVNAPAASSKQKWIELHNPDVKIELSFTGSFTFKWSFDWEAHTFEWRRESCYLIRKPDPPVQVAVTREPAGRIKTSQVQLLDYNLNRFDIDDRKGLEIIMLAALLSFQDHSEALRSNTSASVSVPPSRHNSDGPVAPPTPSKSTSDGISATQTIHKSHENDVFVGDDGSIEGYANHCVQLLKDPSMLYIILRSRSPEYVPKVIQVAEATKRFHYKSGGHNEELYQYVSMEDKKPENDGPKIIKLDGGSSKKKEKEYRPPQAITVHLSKIPMPELQPKAPESSKASNSPPKQSAALRPPGKGGRTPSPSRPGDASSSSAPPHKISKPHHGNASSSPYSYNMALYPPTGPPPSLSSDKPNKHGKQQKHQKTHSPSGSNPPHQTAPAGPAFPTPYGSSSKPTPPLTNPGFTSPYPSAPNPWTTSSSGGAMNAQRPQSQSGQLTPGSYTSYNSSSSSSRPQSVSYNKTSSPAPLQSTYNNPPLQSTYNNPPLQSTYNNPPLQSTYNNTPYSSTPSSSTAQASSQQYFGPPPVPPPPSSTSGQPAQGPSSIGTTLTNGIASVGYSLLDKLTHKQTIQAPAKP